MKELNITINKENIHYLHYIKQSIETNKIKYYCAVCEINDMGVFSLAIQEEDFFVIKNKLKQAISEVILFAFKEKFLIDNINFSNMKESYKLALLKALVLFDSESDKLYIKSKLNFDNDIYLESFYNFKLQNLKKRWLELVKITNENNNLLESETFLELLKFLIATIKPKTSLVNVYYNGAYFEFKDKNQKNIKSNFIENFNDEANLITTLITLAPNYINLHCINALSNNTFKILYYIFDKKINLLV